MSAPQWTPGPWGFFEPAEADQFTHGFDKPGVRAWRIFSKVPDGKPGCRCVGTLVPGHFNDEGPTEANARLIAAAPALYEALDQIVGRVRPESDGEEDEVAEARAALALARGETEATS